MENLLGHPGEGGTPEVTPAEPAQAPEPTVAELIEQGMSKVMDHVDSRFAQSEQAMAERVAAASVKPEPGTPAEPQPGWKPQTWDDFPALVEKMGREAAEKVIAERDEQAKKSSDEVAAFQKQIDDEIDRQTKELVKSGRIPEIKDAASVTDPGKVALRELYAFAAWQGTPDLTKAQTALDKYHSAGYRFDADLYQKDNNGDAFVKANPVSPGKYAPVGSSSANAGASAGTGPSYEQISKAGSLSELVDRFG